MRFVSIQKLRGLAALSVVFYHVNEYLVSMGGRGDTIFRHFKMNFGFFGITLFFVISGFIMAYILAYSPKKFLLRRLVRIYPPFIAAVVLVVAMKFLVLGRLTLPSPQALLLLPFGDIDYPLGIEWTLVYEIFFYLICCVFTLGAFKGRGFFGFLFCWFVAVVTMQYSGFFITRTEPGITEILFSGFNIPFIVGGLFFYLFDRSGKPGRTAAQALLFVSIALIVLGLAFEFMLYKLVSCATGTGLLIFLLSHREAAGGERKKSWPELLGDFSYGIYLVHVPAIVAVYLLGMRLFGRLDSAVGVAALVLAVFAGCIYGRFDVFLHKRLKNLFIGA